MSEQQQPRRTLHRTEDGGLVSDQVTILYQDASGTRLYLHIEPDRLYDLVRQAVRGGMTFGMATGNEEEAKRRNIARMIRAAVKGLLIACGSQILDILIGPGHPKPGKGDELLPWYEDMFTRIGISYLMQHDLVLEGKTIDGTLESATLDVGAVAARSLAQIAGEGASGASRGGKASNDPQSGEHLA
jgi:hypothetical protein